MRWSQVIRAALWTFLTAYLSTFSEWLFFATMPSAISRLAFSDMLRVLCASALWLALCSIALFLPFAIAALSMPARPGRIVLAVCPAGIATTLGILLTDNFTTTIVGIRLAEIDGAPLLCYAAASGAVAIRLVMWFAAKLKRGGICLPLVTGSLATLSLSVVSLRIAAAGAPLAFFETRPVKGPLPHIFLIGVDGLPADRTSFYGYERSTTPALDSLRDESLYAENAFTCAGNTRTVVNALLTGKSPIATGVYSRGAFSGRSSFEHLPGLLRSLGYSNIQAGTEHWIDADHANLRLAFDMENGERTDDPWPDWFPTALAVRFSPDFFLADSILSRAGGRVLHLTGLRPMADPLAAVADPPRGWRLSDRDDEKRIVDVIRFVEEASGPVFAHIHLLSTHCCKHFGKVNRFWREEMTAAEKAEAKYDNTVREADDYVADLFRYLEVNGLLDRSIIVYYSDHGRRWSPTVRVPLIFRFPGGMHAGRLRNVASLLDVAPTLLDYLGQPIPGWMDGESLIAPGFESSRRTLLALAPYWHQWSGESRHEARLRGKLSPDWSGGVVYFECGRWHGWHWEPDTLVSGKVPGYTGPCDSPEAPSPESVTETMLRLLRGYDFDRRPLWEPD